jgi:ABC-2 type transport system ATP-binding protein
MGPLIEVRGLHVTYGRSRVGLAGVDLAVAPGEIVAVLGPNGSGKSTLVRTLAGDLRAAAGTVRVSTREIGWAPDEAVHIDALSVHANAALFAEANGGAAAVRAVPRLLEAFALDADAALPAGELSFGGRRKLMLAQALAHSPALLLLDEPTVGLDPRAIDRLFTIMRASADRGGAVVFASNDVVAAGAIATRVVFVRAGRIIADDAPAALLRAVHGATRIEIDVTGARPDVAFGPDVRATVIATGWVLEAPAGPTVLPDVCARATAAGARIVAIRIHGTDLADAFRALTGEDWRPAPAERA